jgi:hypothetical protein
MSEVDLLSRPSSHLREINAPQPKRQSAVATFSRASLDRRVISRAHSKSNEFGRPLGPLAALSKLKGSVGRVTSLFIDAFSAAVDIGKGGWAALSGAWYRVGWANTIEHSDRRLH